MSQHIRFGDRLEFDVAAGLVRCRGCGRRICGLADDYKDHLAVEEAPMARAGPHRGEEYDRGRFSLRLYYCPGCGAQLETEIVGPGAPRPGFRLNP